MQVWSSVIFVDDIQESEFFPASGCSLLETFHLCHVAWHVSGRAQKECMKPDFAFKHQIACIQAIYKAPCHDAVQHQRGKMISSTLCVSKEMPDTFIFRMPQKGIHRNVTSITYVYLNVEKIPPVLIQHHKQSALCICVCVCVCVCVEMLFHDSRGSRMISRLEHKSLLARGSLCFVLCAKPAIHNDLQRRYML